MIQLRSWEVALGTLGVLVALLWLVGRLFVPSLILLLVLLVAGASRATVVERQVAGAHARTRGLLALVQALALLGLLLVALGIVWMIDRRDWSEATLRMIVVVALAGLAIYLLRDISRYADKAADHLIGGRFEQEVARELEPLREQGWEIAHNIPREGRGNVDIFASGGACAFAIEVKSGRYRAADRGQAISNAIWAKGRFGKRFVIAVLCVGTDPPAEPRLELHGRSEVWVVSPSCLRDWLVRHRWEPRRTA